MPNVSMINIIFAYLQKEADKKPSGVWCFVRLLLVGFCLGWCGSNIHAETIPPYRLAFYYGTHPPHNQLKFYPAIVIEPSKAVDVQQLTSPQRKLYAYTSLGEAINLHQYDKPIDKAWVIAHNDNWNSLVLDQTNPAWQAFYLNHIITPLWKKGYRGFFLDTLDSYRLASLNPQDLSKQQAGIVATIQAIKKKYPSAHLILNRGFEVLPQVKSLIDGIVAESLFNGWDNKNQRYVLVSEKNRQQLLVELNRAKNMGIPVTVVDYLAPENANQAPVTAKKIAALGFNPWVTDGLLTKLYLFNTQTLPRKILLFYQGQLHNEDERIGSYASRAIAMPLNHMGYVTELHNIEAPFPTHLSNKTYAGIVVAIDGFLLDRQKELYAWYQEVMKQKIPLVILNQFGFPLSHERLKPFYLSMPLFSFSPHAVKVLSKSPLIGYEIDPPLALDFFTPVKLQRGKSLLRIVDDVGNQADVAAITPWGGYYLSNNFLISLIGDSYRWSINPFEFFKQALRLPDRPIPDTTTENGKRLLFVHIDGDGFANKGEWYKGPFTGEIFLKEFLTTYAIPTTVSIVQGEIAANGLHPDLSPQLEAIARQIFALPYVEIASHTYSHPYNWRKAALHKGNTKNPFILPIPNYQFNLHTEIVGSVDYINQQLAPKGKSCKLFLWSGEGDVPEKALQFLDELGIGNLNPGTLITPYNQSATRVSALGLNQGPYFQVFAPIVNDDETISHSKIFYSLIGIIEALKLTETPQRLKPIDLYFHFYSVSQLGGIKALHAVYDWAMKQDIMNIYASDYYQKVRDFNELELVQQEGGWFIASNGALREFRIPAAMGYPDIDLSRNIIGYKLYQGHHYIHLGPAGESFLKLTPTAPTLPYVVSANARITQFTKHQHGVNVTIEGNVLPVITWGNMQGCSLWEEQKKVAASSEQDQVKTYTFKHGLKHQLAIQCQ